MCESISDELGPELFAAFVDDVVDIRLLLCMDVVTCIGRCSKELFTDGGFPIQIPYTNPLGSQVSFCCSVA